jgi:hypothetical protein
VKGTFDGEIVKGNDIKEVFVWCLSSSGDVMVNNSVSVDANDVVYLKLDADGEALSVKCTGNNDLILVVHNRNFFPTPSQ